MVTETSKSKQTLVLKAKCPYSSVNWLYSVLIYLYLLLSTVVIDIALLDFQKLCYKLPTQSRKGRYLRTFTSARI